jgi:actin related protein 2/3 complex subunit 2
MYFIHLLIFFYNRKQLILYDFKILCRNGSSDLLAKLFPGLETTPDATFDVALTFDCDKYANNTEFLSSISQIKRHLLGGPMYTAFSALESGSSVPASSYAYRMNEMMFLSTAADKVVVIYLVDFQETMDKAMSRIFLQDFVEGQRSVRTAPPVSFSKEPPQELASFKFPVRENVSGYISFSIEKRHIEGAKKDTAITLLTGFRSYLHYHIKCSKTYLQMRMRKRVTGWLQVLNRAVPEVETEKKTATGKTFTRK